MPASEAPREAPAGDRARPKVLYVMGAGRSGSTILGIALGNCEGVFFAGELNKWLARGGTPSIEDPERERFWSGVRTGMPDVRDLVGGQTAALERSSALFQPRAWRARRRLRKRYRSSTEALYLTISSRAGAGTIVDTSHYPLRARELRSLAGVELYVLLLVRDPQAVVASLGRKDVVERSFGALAANAYLLLTHVLSVWVFLTYARSRRLFVRYEQLRADPERVLRRILDLVESGAPMPDLNALATGVPLHGNRLAQEQVVALDRSSEQPSARSLLTKVVQFPAAIALSRLRPAAAAGPRQGALRAR